jgi:hypothetical protein
MSVPTWDELKARNAAATKFNISALMRVAGETDTGRVDDIFSFWHGRGGRWWVERNGEIVHVSSTATERVPVTKQGGQMVYQRGRGLSLGRVFSPSDLFGPRSLLTNRGGGLRGVETACEVDLAGRATWAIKAATDMGTVIEFAFDARTGIVVRVDSLVHDKCLNVTDLVEHDHLPDTRFTWRGPAIEVDQRRDLWLSW